MSCEEEEGKGGGRKIPMQKKNKTIVTKTESEAEESQGKMSSTLELIENQFKMFIPSLLDLEPELECGVRKKYIKILYRDLFK